MPSEGFEPAIPIVERLQSDALDHTATGIVTFLSSVCLDPVVSFLPRELSGRLAAGSILCGAPKIPSVGQSKIGYWEPFQIHCAQSYAMHIVTYTGEFIVKSWYFHLI